MKRVGLYTAVIALSLMAFTIKDVVKEPVNNRSLKHVPKEIVTVSPNPTSNGMITINNNDTEDLHIYVFDEESTMLHQIDLKGNSKQVISQLVKGTYTYEVFKNEVSIKQGKIISK